MMPVLYLQKDARMQQVDNYGSVVDFFTYDSSSRSDCS